MAVKTQGTQLYFADIYGSSGCELMVVECTTSLTGLSNPREQIDVTCLESTAREFEAGLSTPGTLTVNLNFDPANESHVRLFQLWSENEGNFKLAIGMGTPVDSGPTLDSDCDFSFPTNRHFVEFEGYVADVPLEMALNSVVTSAVSIQISGSYILHPKTA